MREATAALEALPPHELKVMATGIASELAAGDWARLAAGIAILSLTDGGTWFAGRHYHAGCPRDGTEGRSCRRKGVLSGVGSDRS